MSVNRLSIAAFAAFAVAAAIPATPALAASKIGVAAAVQNDVTALIGGSAAPLAAGNQLVQQEVVRTGVASVAQLIFLDQTSLTVGPKAQVKLDKFVFDPNKSTGDVILSATKGAFRFVSGTQDPHSYMIKTPVATIGTRGTIGEGYLYKEAGIFICEEGSMLVDGILLHAGEAIVVYAGGGHDGPFTPDGSFFAVEGRFPFPLYGHDLGPLIDKFVGGNSVGDIVGELKSQDVEGPPPPPCIPEVNCPGDEGGGGGF